MRNEDYVPYWATQAGYKHDMRLIVSVRMTGALSDT